MNPGDTMVLSEHKRFIEVGLCWLISIAATGIVYALFLMPLNRSVKKIENLVNEKMEKLNHASHLVSQQSLLTSEERLARSREQFGRFVKVSDQVSDFALNVSQIAEGLLIKNLSTEGRAEGIFHEIPNCSSIGMNRIDVSWQGTYPQFVRMVNALERHQPVILIDQFTLSGGETNVKSSRVKMALAMLVEKRKNLSEDSGVKSRKRRMTMDSE